MRVRPLSCCGGVLLGIGLAACENDPTPTTPSPPSFATAKVATHKISPLLVEINRRLEARGAKIRVDHAEWLSANNAVGQIIFANDRDKQLGFRWIPGDPRRGALDDALTYVVDQSDGATSNGLTNAQTEAAIDRALQTWDSGTQCSNLPVVKLTDDGSDFDLVDLLLGFPGAGFDNFLADIVEAGWVPAPFFDLVVPGGSQFILGVTFTFNFVGDLDINDDGFIDTALKEVYYNDGFAWGIDTGNGDDIDVQSVALHENGHSFDLAHFGRIFGTFGNGKIHLAPRAVMNAAYSGQQQEFSGSDLAGHCSLFGSWPNH